MTKIIKQEIESTFNNLIPSIYPYIGKGEMNKEKIDEIATNLYIELYYKLEQASISVDMLGIEGKRDGVYVPELRTKDSDLKLIIDPIEGTLTGARGGSRCLSVVGLYYDNNKLKALPDDIDFFYIGSHISPDLGDDFFSNMSVSSNWRKNCKKNNFSISSLHRSETLEILNTFFQVPYKLPKFWGEETTYYPMGIIDNFLLVGDSTIFCPFETDYYFGRSGSIEGRIESGLWKYWKAILVSSEKMKKYSKGKIQYIKDRIMWAKGDPRFNINDFFTKIQISNLKKMNWNENEIKKILNKEDIISQLVTLWICSITGTKDNNLNIHSKFNLKPISYTKNLINFEILKMEGEIGKCFLQQRKITL